VKPGDILTVDDFKFKLHTIGMRLSDKQFKKLVKDIDADGDLAISYEEFTDYFQTEQGAIHAQSLTSESELARSVWDKLDVDKSGNLSLDEIKSLFQKLGQKLSKSDVQAKFDEIDTDGDGEIDYLEFSAWWHEQHEDAVGDVQQFTRKADFMRNVRQRRASLSPSL
jgi:calmodulin